MGIKIYSCDASRGVRPMWTAEEMGLKYESEMMPFPPRFLHKEFMDINILGTIPYLIDGEVVTIGQGRGFKSSIFDTELPEIFSSSALGPATLGIRPEQIRIQDSGNIQKQIHLVEPLGKDTLLYFETDEERELIAIVDSNSSYRAGDSVHLDLIPEHIFLFSSDGKRILN